MNHQENIERIKTIFDALGDLQSQAVFVGGATVSLYADVQAFEVRETDDVDVIIQLANYPQHVRFEEQLRERGFVDDVTSRIRGRFKVKGVTVDVIPTEDVAMGFKNIWYPEGFTEAMSHAIDENTDVKILSAPYFIATKLEAFKSRGKKDGRTSQDFEDIVYVLENRTSIWEEIRGSREKLKGYLINEFKILLSNPNIYEWVDCHVDFSSPPSTDWILDEFQELVNQ
jgi:predicted nucleotidyltransferase